VGSRAKKWPTFNEQNKSPVTQGPYQSQLDAGYAQAREQGVPGSGGTPGANPRYEQPTLGDKLIDAFKNIIRPKPKRGAKP
jgi:hypothetical protein